MSVKIAGSFWHGREPIGSYVQLHTWAKLVARIGLFAAIGVKQASKRFAGFGTFARRAPYGSSALIILVGLYVGYHGLQSLHAAGVV